MKWRGRWYFIKLWKKLFSNLFSTWEKCVSLNCGNFCRTTHISIRINIFAENIDLYRYWKLFDIDTSILRYVIKLCLQCSFVICHLSFVFLTFLILHHSRIHSGIFHLLFSFFSCFRFNDSFVLSFTWWTTSFHFAECFIRFIDLKHLFEVVYKWTTHP